MTAPTRTAFLALVAALAACRAPDGEAALAIRDVTVIDVVDGVARPAMSIVMRGSRIVQVGPADATPIPRGAQVIDGRGRFAIPGLWDMHSHSLWSDAAMRSFLPLYVIHGVTGIRDMGGTLATLDAYRDTMTRADPPWPRVVAAGMVLGGPQPIQPDIAIAVPDSSAAVAVVDSLARRHVDFIKVYTLLPRAAYDAAIAEARRVGLPVAGHVPAGITPRQAAQAGQRSIEHLRDEIEPYCRRTDTLACAALAAIFRADSTWQVPTLAVLWSKAHFDDSTLSSDPRLDQLPPAVRAEWLASRASKLQRGPEYAAEKRERYATEVWLVGFLAAHHVPLLAGTDAGNPWVYPGSGLHDELELMVSAGLTPLEALRAATLNPAIYLGARDTLGSVAPGQVADLVLLRANPLDDIRATRQVESVILRGQLLDRATLDAMLAEVAARAAH